MLENYNLSVIPTKYEGYKVGETIKFFAYMTDSSHQVFKGIVHYVIFKNMREVLDEGILDFADICPAVEIIPDEPCSIQCKLIYEIEGKQVLGQCGVMVEPHRIAPVVAMPDDFDQFWDSWKSKLAKVPINAKKRKISDGQIEVYDVTLDCIGGRPVNAILGLPKNREGKRYPLSVAFQGAGVRSARVEEVIPMVNRGFITMEVSAHGLDNLKSIEYYEEVKKKMGAYNIAGFDGDNREDIYFLNMFLRAKRAIDFVTTLDEWDGKNLMVKGSSMGAFQTFASAYLDSRVSAIATGVPAGCNILGGGWPLGGDYKNITDAKKQRLQKMLPYFDNVNFARKLTIPVKVSMGLIDPECVPDSVYAAYNAYAGEKSIIEEPTEGHSMPLRAHRALWDFLANNLQ